jgi:hypothetical protein
VQLPPWRWQHTLLKGEGRHSNPVQQSVAVAQVVPPARQAWQLPPTHWSVPAQVPPVQHACPVLPHIAGGGPHRPSLHTSVPPQVLPAQQGWPDRPHAVGRRQAPETQSSPGSQARPQQACPSAPQGGGRMHTPLVQLSPSPQVLPVQQGWSRAPQATQVLVWQTKPPWHTSPRQQGCPAAPQALRAVHSPSMHTAPSQQSAGVVQGSPGVRQQRPPLQP